VFLSVVLSELLESRALEQIQTRLNTISTDITDITSAERALLKAQVREYE